MSSPDMIARDTSWPPTALTLLVVDDHPLIRHGIRTLVGTAVQELTLMEASSVAEAWDSLEQGIPDIAIVDMLLPDRSGLELIREMREKGVAVPILGLSMNGESTYAERALRAGASGYVMKEEVGEVLLEAMARVLSGEVHLSPQMARRIAGRVVPTGASDAVVTELLTNRELEVWRHLGSGHSTRKIASILQISPKTVETHCYNIRGKTGIHDMTQLVHAATRWLHGDRTPLRP